MDRFTYISRRVVDFYAENPPTESQIMHTQSVAHFTRLISEGDELQEVAAWLHDIGCPPAKKKYGDSKPPHQEAEGKRLVHEWLDGSDLFTQEEVDWLADAVGGHHRITEAKRLHFEPLYEADLIVNLFEGYYTTELARKFVETGAVSTPIGMELFGTFFNLESDIETIVEKQLSLFEGHRASDIAIKIGMNTKAVNSALYKMERQKLCHKKRNCWFLGSTEESEERRLYLKKAIVSYLQDNPGARSTQIAKDLNVSTSLVNSILFQMMAQKECHRETNYKWILNK